LGGAVFDQIPGYYDTDKKSIVVLIFEFNINMQSKDVPHAIELAYGCDQAYVNG
jgi:hypothetical protein